MSLNEATVEITAVTTPEHVPLTRPPGQRRPRRLCDGREDDDQDRYDAGLLLEVHVSLEEVAVL